MRKTVKSVDKILPYGETIRGFLNQSFLTESDMRMLLRERGVFLSDYSKNNSVPFITSSLVSPEEFDGLKDAQGTREDSPKRTNEVLYWNHGSDTLKTAIDENRGAILEALVPKNCNYKLLSKPRIVFEGTNNNQAKILLDIERNDLNKSWFEAKNSFTAEVFLDLDVEKEQLRVTKTYSSEETKDVVSTLTRNLRFTLIEKGYVNKEKKIETIRFKDFDNKSRFSFLTKLGRGLNDNTLSVEFKDTTDIQFKSDPDVTLPEHLKWMNDKSKVIFNGKNIHQTDFLTVAENYQLLIVWSIETTYRFNLGNVMGSLILYLGFPDYSRGQNENAELVITPVKCNIFDRSYINKKHAIVKKLLDEIDKIKFDVYDEYKKQDIS